MKKRTRFRTWCRKDINDTTKILYTFKMKESDGSEHIEHFTSDTDCTGTMIGRIGDAWIESIAKVVDGSEAAWNVVIYED